MRTVPALIVVLAATSSSPRAADLHRFQLERMEMAAPVTIVLYAEDETIASRAAAAAFDRIRELNSILSDWDPDSELSRLCRDASGSREVRVSADLWRVLSRAAEISEASDGAFDVTVGPVVRLWRRARALRELPSPERLAEARALVDRRGVGLDPATRSVTLRRPGTGLDLGGIAKGYAADAALGVLRGLGIDRALVAVAGDIAVGTPPPGLPGWTVGVAPYPGDTRPMERLCLSNVGVSTSGDTEQFVVIGGTRYSHVVDPRTGLGLTDHSTVTVVAPDATTADALATAASVLGPSAGLELIDRQPGASARMVRRPGGALTTHESSRWKEVPLAASPPRETAFEGASRGEGRRTSLASFPVADAPDAGPADWTKGVVEGTRVPRITVAPPVSWMLEPVALPEATAGNEADMKPYSERIPGTEVSFDLVPIRGGKFVMGSPDGEPKRQACEGARTEVQVEPFWMAKCEVSWDEYELWGLGYDFLSHGDGKELPPRDCLADAITRPTKPYSDMTFGMGKRGFPAICMSQLAAKVYCKWLSAKTGRYYRLPTEAEWEYACRAGTTTAYSFGDDPKDLADHAWFYDDSQDKYHEVGKKKPNPWGLHDMHGNVAEWVLDKFTPEGYPGTPCANPLVVPDALHPRVIRGGSWLDDPDRLRSAARRGSTIDWNSGDPQMPKSIWYLTNGTFVGFRAIRPLRVPTAEEAARYDIDETQRLELTDYLEFLAGRQ